jgi:hypothetical protein
MIIKARLRKVCIYQYFYSSGSRYAETTLVQRKQAPIEWETGHESNIYPDSCAKPVGFQRV